VSSVIINKIGLVNSIGLKPIPMDNKINRVQVIKIRYVLIPAGIQLSAALRNRPNLKSKADWQKPGYHEIKEMLGF